MTPKYTKINLPNNLSPLIWSFFGVCMGLFPLIPPSPRTNDYCCATGCLPHLAEAKMPERTASWFYTRVFNFFIAAVTSLWQSQCLLQLSFHHQLLSSRTSAGLHVVFCKNKSCTDNCLWYVLGPQPFSNYFFCAIAIYQSI